MKDREMIEILIKEHEGEEYREGNYETIDANVWEVKEGRHSVKVCYKVKDNEPGIITLLHGDVINGEAKSVKYMFLGKAMIETMHKAIE